MKRSEVHAYNYILNELLTKKGWSKSQVYTQQECQKIPVVAKCLKNQTKGSKVRFYDSALHGEYRLFVTVRQNNAIIAQDTSLPFTISNPNGVTNNNRSSNINFMAVGLCPL